jgi:periplasmic glucans biosynthesis protein
MPLTRRTILALIGAALAAPAGARSQLELGAPMPFDWDWLVRHAKDLASRPYVEEPRPAPAIVEELEYGPHQDIVQPIDSGLYAHGPGECPVTFFHLGRLFPKPVRMYSLIDGSARRIVYRKALFEYPPDNPAARMPEDAGFAGFRVHDPRKGDAQAPGDWLAFLGASYFRARGDLNQYGASARGIAIDTASERPEEFPDFRAFWIEPLNADGQGRIFALLDGPSLSGAYRFDVSLHPESITNVSCTLNLRRDVQRFGIAALTSMFYYGKINRFIGGDWRPSVHDNEGLAIWNGIGEQLWRPLNNPPHMTVSSFADNGPRGFGLLQRARDFRDFEDGENWFERRPNVWVEPASDWGQGAVQLVEIPTDVEYGDNIGAFWVPREPARAGSTHSFAYRLHWSGREHFPAGLARCAATRMSKPWNADGGAYEQGRYIIIDFAGDILAGADPNEARIDLTIGRRGIVPERTLKRHPTQGPRSWRLVLLVGTSGRDPIEARLVVRQGDRPLTETWLAQLHPGDLTPG